MSQKDPPGRPPWASWLSGAVRLGLPLKNVGTAWIVTGCLFVFYSLTMAQDLSAYDSAELALVAADLGLGHPIGQPTHTLLGFVSTLVPGVSPLLGITLCSAVPAALCAVVVFSLVEQMGGPVDTVRKRTLVAVGLLAAGIQYTVWEPASRVEVYALAGFLGLQASAYAVGILEATPISRRRVVLSGLFFGLSAATNAYVAVFMAVPFGCLLLWKQRTVVPVWVTAGVGGLLPFLYLPLATFRAPHTFVWGEPSTWDALLPYLAGSDYQHSRQLDQVNWTSNLSDFAEFNLETGALVWILVGLGGLWSALPRHLALALSAPTGLTILLLCSNVTFAAANPDYAGYLSPVLWLSATGVVCWALKFTPSKFSFVPIGVGLIASTVSTPHPLERNQSQDRALRTMTEALLDEAPDGAVVLVQSDYWAAPLLYLQEIEERRPDVLVVAVGLSSSSWYWRHLAARHPNRPEFALAGPGGQVGRISRLLAANPESPVMVESLVLAVELGVPITCIGLVAHQSCSEPSQLATNASEQIAAARRGVRSWSPSSEAIAAVSLQRGSALWRLGSPELAHEAFAVGIGDADAEELLDASSVADAPPLRGPPLSWQRGAAIGDPARNLFLLAQMYRSAGQTEASARLLATARADGLPEANLD